MTEGGARQSLAGRRIVVTRARAQAADLADALEALGAEVVHFPVIRIADPPDPAALRTAAREVAAYDWVIFTSANGVDRFWSALRESGRDARALTGVRVCAIGPGTAAALEARGVAAELVPDAYVAEALVDAMAAAVDLRGARILLPRAEVARAVLPDSLRAMGAAVTEVAAYTTVPDGAGADDVRRALAAGELDAVTFTAASTVHNFVDLIGSELGRAQVAAIGPITSAAARERGLEVNVEASEYTIPGLVEALRDFFAKGA